MRRIISMLISAVYSLFAGTGFTLPKQDDYYFGNVDGEGAYFQPDISETDIQYKLLYDEVRGFTDSGAYCDITRRQTDRPTWVELSDKERGMTDLPGVFDPVYVPTDDESNYTVDVEAGNGSITYTIHVEAEVCAPATGTIVTSHYACNYGSEMTYSFSLSGSSDSYVVEITGAKCWYCCSHKEEPADGRYTATTTDSLRGKDMRTGDVLCISKEGTKIVVKRANV